MIFEVRAQVTLEVVVGVEALDEEEAIDLARDLIASGDYDVLSQVDEEILDVEEVEDGYDILDLDDEDLEDDGELDLASEDD